MTRPDYTKLTDYELGRAEYEARTQLQQEEADAARYQRQANAEAEAWTGDPEPWARAAAAARQRAAALRERLALLKVEVERRRKANPASTQEIIRGGADQGWEQGERDRTPARAQEPWSLMGWLAELLGVKDPLDPLKSTSLEVVAQIERIAQLSAFAAAGAALLVVLWLVL